VRRTIILLPLLLIPAIAPGRDKKITRVKVEVVEQSEGMQGSFQMGGAIGTAVGRRVVTDAWTTRAIINGDHALLTCYENHHACSFLGVGTYDAELKIHPHREEYAGYHGDEPPELWIHFIRPVDHVDIREHWKVTGSW
jgi:hypothetical protein